MVVNGTVSDLEKIPFHDFGGKGEVLHFAHANGFPPGVYSQFLKPFTEDYKVLAIKHRPLWQAKPNKSDNWHKVTEDLIRFLDEQGLKNIIGVGHSMGGVASMFAAVKRPDLFKKLILIEPVFVQTSFNLFLKLMPTSLQKKMNPMIKGALRRRDSWESKEIVYNSFRKKRVFSRISDEALKDYVEFCTKPNEKGGVELAYSKEWEAHFYSMVPYVWSKLRKADLPMMGIRGEKTDTIFPKAWAKWQAIHPKSTFLEMEKVGHLLPLEEPKELYHAVLNFLKQE